MLISRKMCVKGKLTQNIVNVPLPSQQAAKILQELQTSCNSPNKATQLEALKCWGAWIQNHGPEEWDNDSVCHFAVKPLATKKLQALHKDVDVCQLKLSLLWEALSRVQEKMELKGSQHILKIFLQSCFAWLSSIDTLDNKITVLIIKLLLSLFEKLECPIICDKYTFSPVQIDNSTFRKFFHIFNDNVLDVFDYWKKVQDNSLIMKLWACFLEYCECDPENITTSVWHRIFRVNQTFCLDHSETIKDRLMFLHACATNVKTVLLSSKYIGGEGCFTTPCEALMKKLVEVCSVEIEELPDEKMFSMCKDVSEVLGNQSIVISDYEICIYLLDHLEDFAYKSFFWGAWCGLVECFKKNLLSVDRQTFTRKQSKFYRKLRGVSVNFELDKMNLTTDSAAMVQSSIGILKIGCFCTLKTQEFNIAKSPKKEESPAAEPEPMEVEFLNESLSPSKLQVVSRKVLPSTSGGNFGNFPVRCAFKKPSLSLTINLRSPHEFMTGVFEFANNDHIKLLFEAPRHTLLPAFNIKPEFPLVQDHCLIESKSNLKMLTYKESESSPARCSEPSTDNKVLEAEKKKETCVSKTRGRKKAEEKEAEETIGKRRRKSFEVLVQEIVTKNKLRKSEKNTKEKKVGASAERKELRSGKQFRQLEDEVVPKRQLRERKIAEEKPPPKKVNNGKLDSFFQVIESKSESGKEKKAKKNKKTKEKGEINWKQPPLTGMITSTPVEKREEKKEKVKAEDKLNRKVKATPEKKMVEPNNLMATSPFKEALQDHEYAKSVEPCVNSDFDKPSKEAKPARGRKPRKKGKVTDDEMTEAETSILEKAEEQALPFEKEVTETSIPEKYAIKTNDDMKPVESSLENSEVKMVERQIVKEFKDYISPNPNVEEKGNNEQISSNSVIEADKEKNISQVKSPENSATVVESECDTDKMCLDVEDKETESEDSDEHTDKICPLLNNMKRRISLYFSPRPRKRFRMSEESLDGDGSSVDVAEKENRESLGLEKAKEMLSPIKESFAETAKEEISPSKKSPSFDRTTSSRALRMMALITEPSSPVGSQTNCEVSTKTGAKHHLRKFNGVDKSSRVSKMLARLSESMKQEGEDLTNGKAKCEDSPPPPLVTTPTSHKCLAEKISPKPAKKKKFIGFDDSKNETILFQTDTPPSQILEQRILLRNGSGL